jgi:AraC family transcriptional regulator of adaptative response/methylated-DNA-[protein]-cysteine methyltransferase
MSDYTRIERAIGYIRHHQTEQPSLEDVARHVGLSEFHFQRLFQRWAGVSPKRFLQFLTLQDAKRLLDDDRSVLDATFALGLSGPSRLHDLFLSLESMTPGQYKTAGAGLIVRWSFEETPFGEALFAVVDRGLCGLSFVGDAGRDAELETLARRWTGASLVRGRDRIRPFAAAVNDRLAGRCDQPLSLLLKGTPLQLRVWEALLRVPEGHVTTYASLARAAGNPNAARAVGSAVGQNPIACLIPCHRVILATGAFGEYHWGSERKLALLAIEHARSTEAARA